MLELTCQGLDKLVQRKQKGKAEKLGAQVGKLLQRYKVGKFLEWKIEKGRLQYQIKPGAVEQEELLDGCYVVSTTVSKELMTSTATVGTYKSLSFVEQAFRAIKTVALEIRPVYHKKDDRIRSHAFLCMLAYYVRWHLEQRLAPLFAEDGQGRDREWTMANVLQNLAGIRKERIRASGAEFEQVSLPTEPQQRLLDLLKITL